MQNLFKENMTNHDYRRKLDKEMKLQNQVEYSRATLEAQLQEKKRLEDYHKFYEDKTRKQLEKV